MTSTTRPTIRLLGAALLLVALLVPTTALSADQAATATRGTFTTLSGGADLGYDLDGHAVMVRSPATGTTRVRVHVSGLEPDTTYGVHVHAASCDTTPPGGGHYQHEVGGAVDAVNEIWPTVTTNAAGVGMGDAVHDHVARADAQAIVIHWPGNAAVRLACLDLG